MNYLKFLKKNWKIFVKALLLYGIFTWFIEPASLVRVVIKSFGFAFMFLFALYLTEK